MNLLAGAPRHLFFTGKGGVGKTSVACATALALAEQGRRVLLVSTDPASNLDEVLATPLGDAPTAVTGAEGLFALNLDPERAAAAYRERIVGPYRGVLPDASVHSIEEQLSGACTVEIAAFDEFSKLLADRELTADFDHVLFDTAPTGHTLRLLELPAAWTSYIENNAGGVSCLGPLAGLSQQRALYESTRNALADAQRTRVVLVARPEAAALDEAERTRGELSALGIRNQHLVLNGLFSASDPQDAIACALEQRGARALSGIAAGLATLERTELSLLPFGLVGLPKLRALFGPNIEPGTPAIALGDWDLPGLETIVRKLGGGAAGIVFTMGKGGVGKTAVATALAQALAGLGRRVHLTTTDPAAHLRSLKRLEADGIRVSRIDPQFETRAYRDEVMRTAGAALDDSGRKLLEEELASPCTEEIAVFRAFARIVDTGKSELVIVDTAPTGHTLLLLDAADAYQREVARSTASAPDEVRLLSARLRDPEFSKVLIVTLLEATPVHEASALQRDLARAGIRPFGWVVNQSLLPLNVTDPMLVHRRAAELPFLEEVEQLTERVAVMPFMPSDAELPNRNERGFMTSETVPSESTSAAPSRAPSSICFERVPCSTT